jgi:hypothetical protein
MCLCIARAACASAEHAQQGLWSRKCWGGCSAPTAGGSVALGPTCSTVGPPTAWGRTGHCWGALKGLWSWKSWGVPPPCAVAAPDGRRAAPSSWGPHAPMWAPPFKIELGIAGVSRKGCGQGNIGAAPMRRSLRTGGGRRCHGGAHPPQRGPHRSEPCSAWLGCPAWGGPCSVRALALGFAAAAARRRPPMGPSAPSLCPLSPLRRALLVPRKIARFLRHSRARRSYLARASMSRREPPPEH